MQSVRQLQRNACVKTVAPIICFVQIASSAYRPHDGRGSQTAFGIMYGGLSN
jgi:hypothetical protein